MTAMDAKMKNQQKEIVSLARCERYEVDAVRSALEKALSPLDITGLKGTFDISVFVSGGGKDAQAEAARHGISRALTLFDPKLRPTLKKAGFLRRDARIRERKKPGLKRARRAPQWAKR